MPAFWQRTHEGYLFVDHRNSPGLPEWMARRVGYDPAQCGEGKLYEAATLGCCHCGVHVVKNPKRTRPRHSCQKCEGRYVCDFCAQRMARPDYVHVSIDQLKDLIDSGRWMLVGPSMVWARLVPVPTFAA
jgi:hypothetical protein